MPIKSSRTIRFIIPGLIDPVPYLKQLPVADLPQLPVFSKMLSRGKLSSPKKVNETPYNLYDCLSRELLPGSIVNEPVSVASLAYACDIKQLSESERSLCEVSPESIQNDLKQSKWIMRADPCFMAADRDQLVLAQTGCFDLTLAEAHSLADEINQFFQKFVEENFWILKVASAERWYIISDKPININSIPPENIIGQPIRDYLFSNKKLSKQNDTSHWLGIFNEIQMILHQSQLNKKRLTEKRIPINSLWFWGAERLKDYTGDDKSESLSKTSLTYSQQSYAQNLCELSQQQHITLSDSALLKSFESHTEREIITYVIDDFARAIRNQDIFSWVGLLQQFEKNYLLPLRNALKNGQVSQIEFISPTGKRLLVNIRSLNRWWKKNRPYYSSLS